MFYNKEQEDYQKEQFEKWKDSIGRDNISLVERITEAKADYVNYGNLLCLAVNILWLADDVSSEDAKNLKKAYIDYQNMWCKK